MLGAVYLIVIILFLIWIALDFNRIYGPKKTEPSLQWIIVSDNVPRYMDSYTFEHYIDHLYSNITYYEKKLGSLRNNIISKLLYDTNVDLNNFVAKNDPLTLCNNREIVNEKNRILADDRLTKKIILDFDGDDQPEYIQVHIHETKVLLATLKSLSRYVGPAIRAIDLSQIESAIAHMKKIAEQNVATELHDGLRTDTSKKMLTVEAMPDTLDKDKPTFKSELQERA